MIWDDFSHSERCAAIEIESEQITGRKPFSSIFLTFIGNSFVVVVNDHKFILPQGIHQAFHIFEAQTQDFNVNCKMSMI